MNPGAQASAVPAVGVGVVGVLAAALLVAAGLAARRYVAGRGGRAARSVPAVLAGVGVAAAVLAGAGLLSYGGDESDGDSASLAVCDPWWAQEGSVDAGGQSLDGVSPYCTRAADAAVLPAVGWALGAGVLAGAATAAIAAARRRAALGTGMPYPGTAQRTASPG